MSAAVASTAAWIAAPSALALPVLAWVVLAVAGLGAAAFVAAELVARAWMARRGPYYVWTPYSRMRLRIDEQALPTLSDEARWEVNSAGERGGPLPDDGTRAYRVLVLGGSASECYFIDQPDTWVEVAARELAKPEALAALGVERVHVGNAARSLVACEELELMLSRTLPRYPRLDAVVLMVGASDVVHWLEQETPSRIESKPIPASQVFAWHPEGPFGWTPRTLALRRVAKLWFVRLFRPVEVRERVGKRLADARAMRQRAKVLLDTTPDPAPMLEHLDTHFRRLVARARSAGARVILARQCWLEKELTPEERALMWNFGAGRPYAQEVTTYYTLEAAWKLLAAADQRVVEVANELGLEVLELNTLVPRDFEHYYDELHHTPKGCAIVGRAVARQVLAGRKAPRATAAAR